MEIITGDSSSVVLLVDIETDIYNLAIFFRGITIHYRALTELMKTSICIFHDDTQWIKN